MAASIEKGDIITESWLLRNVQDRRRSRGQREFVIQGLTGDSGDLDEANLFLESNLAGAHPEDSSLPLREVRSRYWIPGKTVSHAVYGHSDASNPTQAPFSFAKERLAGHRRAPALTRIYYSGGSLTSEVIQDTSNYVWDTYDGANHRAVTFAVTPTTNRVAVTQIVVPAGLLSSHPGDSVGDLVGDYNSDAVCINGLERAANTLRFETADILPVDVGGTIKYQTHYVFSYCPVGWGAYSINQYSVTAEPYDSSGITIRPVFQAFSATYNTALPASAFEDAFPLYTGTGPKTDCVASGSP